MCALEFPGLESEFNQVYGPLGVQVIGVNASHNDTDATLNAFVDQTGVTFPIGYDQTTSYEAFRAAVSTISPYPVDVIVDAAGNIAYLAGEYRPEELAAKLDDLVP